MENNNLLSRQQKLDRCLHFNKDKRLPKVEVNRSEYIKSFKGYKELINEIGTEFIAADGRKVREVL